MSLNGEQQPAVDPAAAPTGSRSFKLPDFWTASPAAWFGIAETQFLLRNINSQQERFALVAAVLPEASTRRMAHLFTNPGDTSYTDMKAALLSAHQLTSFQKAERLFSSEPLGDRRPSELLSELLEWVHPGDERSRLFAMLFLRRLPAAIRLQLTEDDHKDLRALAEKADRCAASIHRHQQLLPIAATGFTEDPEFQEQEDISVSAVGSGQGRRNSGCSRGNGRPFKSHCSGQQ